MGGKRRKQRSRRDPDGDQPKGRGGTRCKMVMAATERGGRARASKGETHSERTIVDFVRKNLDIQGRTVLCIDSLPAYRWIGSKFGAHLRVNHLAGEYVRRDRHHAADAHTNTVESFNAMLKRALMGVWHWFSIKHTAMTDYSSAAFDSAGVTLRANNVHPLLIAVSTAAATYRRGNETIAARPLRASAQR